MQFSYPWSASTSPVRKARVDEDREMEGLLPTTIPVTVVRHIEENTGLLKFSVIAVNETHVSAIKEAVESDSPLGERTISHIKSNVHFVLDLVNDHNLTTLRTRELFPVPPASVPCDFVRNVTNITFCEPYLIRYGDRHRTQYSNAKSDDSCLRRMTIIITKAIDHKDETAAWVRGNPRWEMLENRDAETLSPYIEGITRREIEIKALAAVDAVLKTENRYFTAQALAPKFLYDLQQAVGWSKPDERQEKAGEREEKKKNWRSGRKTQKGELTGFGKWSGFPMKNTLRHLDDEEVKQESWEVEELKKGIKFSMRNRAEAARAYKTAQWKGGESVWKEVRD